MTVLSRPLAAHEILDALENVSDNEEDYRERLICILPPPVDPDCLTDEDSGEEDNVTLNNLPRNILLQPAEVMIQGQIMSAADNTFGVNNPLRCKTFHILK
ncbi:hypothetical protein B5X24_HaOG204464 [Helicoverpa armigera]|uniref:Uncharacterized protein n=1 Tax=Helicoverpa armigera TaxID=29058 RepID=A0A2W1BSG0_HELAM|nr:hypothetical protein B5X24_HaOG204464 [Helicoverpa armigera]